MRGIFELVSQILARPVFIMFAVSPESGRSNIVNNTPEGHPDLGFILPVPEGELGTGDHGQQVVVHRAFRWLKSFTMVYRNWAGARSV